MRLVRDVLEWRNVEGEIVVLDLRSATYLAVSGAGAVLWPALLEGAAFGELTDAVVEAFDVAPARAAEDVETFLGQLAAQDVLEFAGPDAAPD